jgi:hypothetical protein
MKTEFRIIFTMTFDNAVDRDAWAAKIKNAIGNAKLTSSAYIRADLTKDDYMIQGRDSEAV